MIRSFADKETEALWRNGRSRLPRSILQRGFDKLLLLNSATNIEQLRRPPSHHLELLRGSRNGQHSIRVNGQWRLCFRWEGADAFDVEICDYH
jgi:proteic killer suppression protein